MNHKPPTMWMKYCLRLIACCLLSSPVFSQEIISPLQVNAVIKELVKKNPLQKAVVGPVQLPFLDDFSDYVGYPNPDLWADRYAYINSTYGLNPPTKEFATLDAINDSGSVYLTASGFPFVADYLTSRSIRLDSLFNPSPAPVFIKDSVYLSFFFSPSGGMGPVWQAIGDAPETDDSLVLEFWSAPLNEWREVWASKGLTQQELYDSCHCYFKRVMIPILDSAAYFNADFKFRFYNYASLSNSSIPSWAGNADQWNIDYIYLNAHRRKTDTVFKDIAFVEPAPGLLKNYSEMPWNQFKSFQSQELKDTFFLKEVNLDTATQLINYKYFIKDANEVVLHTFDGGSNNILPFIPNGFHTYGNHATPPFTYTLPVTSSDTASFSITHILRKDNNINDFRPKNDTNRITQHFYNYFAYDDGSAENGYGLNPANSMLAYRFHLNQTDTLRAVQMYFNQVLENANQKQFYLMVWNESLGLPATVLYQKLVSKPVYEYELNKFHCYPLDNPIVLSGNFYVGWLQTTADNLNLGFDRNTSSESNILYNTNGSWATSFSRGSLMIRPMLGAYFTTESVPDIHSKELEVSLYPNPNSIGKIFLKTELQDTHTLRIQIYTAQNQLLSELPYSDVIPFEYASNGFYWVKITDVKTRQFVTKKLVILK